jgi:hypothetical protein
VLVLALRRVLVLALRRVLVLALRRVLVLALRRVPAQVPVQQRPPEQPSASSRVRRCSRARLRA